MEINTINNRTSFLKSIVFGLITFLIFSCDQDPSKKINAENVKAVEERIDKAYDLSLIHI